MKKVIALSLALIMVFFTFALSGCGSKQPVFDFLCNYTKKNGSIKASADSETYEYEFKHAESSNDYSCGIQYKPSEDKVNFTIKSSTGNGMTVLFTLVLTKDMESPYSLVYLCASSKSTIASGLSSVYPSSFSKSTSLSFSIYNDNCNGALRQKSSGLATVLVNGLLGEVYYCILSPNGYTMEDLGFLSLELTNAENEPAAKKQDIFDFLAGYAIENGSYDDSNKGYIHFFKTNYTTNSILTCAVTYDPYDEKITLGCLLTSDSGDSQYSMITIDSQMGVPYDLYYQCTFSGGSESSGLLHLYPGPFTGDTPLSFYSYSGSSYLKSNLAGLASGLVYLTLLHTEEVILTPNGYTLADLGFTSM